jgi:SpoVK/Ycf46/Vps4 family AAA+-type ATPase
LALSADVNVEIIAQKTAGFTGASIAALVHAATSIAVERIPERLANGTISLEEPPDDESMSTAPDRTGAIQPFGSHQPSTSRSCLNLSPHLLSASPMAKFLQAHAKPLTPTQLSRLHVITEDVELALRKVKPKSK